jgi:hypothetical protein
MKLWIATLIMALGGCAFSAGGRPDQGNFTVRASKLQVERLVRADGSTATVILTQMADDRCDPNAPLHSTFNNGEYRIDLVYRSKSHGDRTSAKNALIRAAHDERLRITDFKECQRQLSTHCRHWVIRPRMRAWDAALSLGCSRSR